MLTCDHIGLVTHSLEQCTQVLALMTSYSRIGPAVLDISQGVTLCFLTDPEREFPRLELLQPLSQDSPVWRRMREGGGVHHLCFQIAGLDGYDELLRRTGYTAVSAPMTAPAFGNGRRVAFVQAPGLGLIEFVETAGAPALETIWDLPVRQLKKSFLSSLS